MYFDPKERGKLALATLGNYAEPSAIFIGDDARKLYELENRRTEIIRACAEEWARHCDVNKKEFWTRSLPQALFDTLEKYQTECSIVAAEAFLKQLGWKVERPS